MANELFLNIGQKSNFNQSQQNSNPDSIGFIKDSNDIWAKGQYYQAIPTDDGKVGQVLVCDENGRGKWSDLSMEDYYSYGISWKYHSAVQQSGGPYYSDLKSIGNEQLRKNNPIQFKLCVYDTVNKGIKYWVSSRNGNSYTTIDDNTTQTLQSGEKFMVYFPTFYGNCEYKDDVFSARISRYRLNYDWFEIPEMFVSTEVVNSSSIPSEFIKFKYKYFIWIFYWYRAINNKNFINLSSTNEIFENISTSIAFDETQIVNGYIVNEEPDFMLTRSYNNGPCLFYNGIHRYGDLFKSTSGTGSIYRNYMFSSVTGSIINGAIINNQLEIKSLSDQGTNNLNYRYYILAN